MSKHKKTRAVIFSIFWIFSGLKMTIEIALRIRRASIFNITKNMVKYELWTRGGNFYFVI